MGKAYGPGVKQILPAPYTVNEASTRDLILPSKLLPGKKATISLTSIMLDQMMRVQYKPFPNADRHDFYRVQAFARIIGASTYDSPDPAQSLVFNFHWRPTGFTAQKCDAIIKLQPRIVLY